VRLTIAHRRLGRFTGELDHVRHLDSSGVEVADGSRRHAALVDPIPTP